jgi:hypothetical protein
LAATYHTALLYDYGTHTILSRYSVAACQVDQPNPLKLREMRRNTERMLSLVDSGVTGAVPFLPVRFGVFPEFAHAAPIFATLEELRQKLAVPIPNELLRIMRRRAFSHANNFAGAKFEVRMNSSKLFCG